MRIIMIAFALLFLAGCSADPLRSKYPRCSEPVYCNDIASIDCNSAADGPLYYINRTDYSVISTCGGACFTSDTKQIELCRKMCPPKEWTCG